MRLKFEINIAGVNKIINGNLKDVDRDNYENVESVDIVLIDPSSFSPMAFDNELKAMEVGGYIIFFDDMTDMDPYLKEIDLFDGEIINPSVDGIRRPDGFESGLWDEYHTNDSNAEAKLLNNMDTQNFEALILS